MAPLPGATRLEALQEGGLRSHLYRRRCGSHTIRRSARKGSKRRRERCGREPHHDCVAQTRRVAFWRATGIAFQEGGAVTCSQEEVARTGGLPGEGV